MFRSFAVPALAAFAAFAALPGPAAADLPSPDPAHSTIPDWISIVGTRNGAPDPSGIFKVVVHDFNDHPLPDQEVKVSVADCADVAICTVSFPPLATASCAVPSGQVIGWTDANGEVTLVAVGAGRVWPNTPGSDQPCVSITVGRSIAAGLTLLGYARARVYDTNGAAGPHGGVTGADLALSQADFLSGTYVTRSDFDGVPPITGTDLAIHQKIFLLLASSDGCHDGTGPQPYCP